MKNDQKRTPYDLLEMWSYALGGAEHRVIAKPSSGLPSSGIDEYELARIYVEGTPGFDRTRDLLVHVHAAGMPVNSFRWRRPGETVIKALLARDWGAFLGYPLCLTGQRAYDAFLDALIERCRDRPFEVGPSMKNPVVTDRSRGVAPDMDWRWTG